MGAMDLARRSSDFTGTIFGPMLCKHVLLNWHYPVSDTTTKPGSLQTTDVKHVFSVGGRTPPCKDPNLQHYLAG
jgi:hypothetical protein